MLERLDFWLAIIALAWLAYAELRLDRLARWLVRAFHALAPAGAPAVEYTPNAASDRSNDVQERSPQQDAAFAPVERSNVQPEPAPFDPPTLHELRLLARAIEHNARGANKQQSIEQAFGVKKGGSSGWRRASQLFDEAMKKEP